MRVPRQVFEELVSRALEEVPPAFAPYLANVMIEVEDLPDARTAAELGLPDRITLYQMNIQRICRTPAQLVRQIRKTVLHEIGHHFGLDEDDLEDVGYS